MANLSDVYGVQYQKESQQSRLDYIINTMANNLGHRQFKFKLHDTKELWAGQADLPPAVLQSLAQKVKAVNSKLQVKHLNKNSDQINMLPELIIDTPVEYFLIIDHDFGRAYFIYITPTEVNSY